MVPIVEWDDPMRFNEIRRTINGISQRMLPPTLKSPSDDALTRSPRHRLLHEVHRDQRDD